MLVCEDFYTSCVDSQFHILIWMMAVCMPWTDNLAFVLRLLLRWMLWYFQHQAVHLQYTALQCPIVGTSVILVIGYTYMILCALTFLNLFKIMIFFSNGRGMRCIYCILNFFSSLIGPSANKSLNKKRSYCMEASVHHRVVYYMLLYCCKLIWKYEWGRGKRNWSVDVTCHFHLCKKGHFFCNTFTLIRKHSLKCIYSYICV